MKGNRFLAILFIVLFISSFAIAFNSSVSAEGEEISVLYEGNELPLFKPFLVSWEANYEVASVDIELHSVASGFLEALAFGKKGYDVYMALADNTRASAQLAYGDVFIRVIDSSNSSVFGDTGVLTIVDSELELTNAVTHDSSIPMFENTTISWSGDFFDTLTEKSLSIARLDGHVTVLKGMDTGHGDFLWNPREVYPGEYFLVFSGYDEATSTELVHYLPINLYYQTDLEVSVETNALKQFTDHKPVDMIVWGDSGQPGIVVEVYEHGETPQFMTKSELIDAVFEAGDLSIDVVESSRFRIDLGYLIDSVESDADEFMLRVVDGDNSSNYDIVEEILRIRKRPDLLNAEWDELIDEGISDLQENPLGVINHRPVGQDLTLTFETREAFEKLELLILEDKGGIDTKTGEIKDFNQFSLVTSVQYPYHLLQVEDTNKLRLDILYNNSILPKSNGMYAFVIQNADDYSQFGVEVVEFYDKSFSKPNWNVSLTEISDSGREATFQLTGGDFPTHVDIYMREDTDEGSEFETCHPYVPVDDLGRVSVAFPEQSYKKTRFHLVDSSDYDNFGVTGIEEVGKANVSDIDVSNSGVWKIYRAQIITWEPVDSFFDVFMVHSSGEEFEVALEVDGKLGTLTFLPYDIPPGEYDVEFRCKGDDDYVVCKTVHLLVDGSDAFTVSAKLLDEIITINGESGRDVLHWTLEIRVNRWEAAFQMYQKQLDKSSTKLQLNFLGEGGDDSVGTLEFDPITIGETTKIEVSEDDFRRFSGYDRVRVDVALEGLEDITGFSETIDVGVIITLIGDSFDENTPGLNLNAPLYSFIIVLLAIPILRRRR